MKPDPNAPARERVLFQLKMRGPQTASQLARRLGVTPMAIRQHLARLEDEGLVDHANQRRKVGRPARLWSLTPRASDRFPDTHPELTLEILGAIRKTLGDEALDRLITERTRDQLKTYRARLPGPEADLAERVEALAAVRREEGYMAECTRERDGTLLLVENHCPICAAAQTCQGLCREELSLFRKLLGRGVGVEREEHLLSGARRCAYRVTPRASASRRPTGRRRTRTA